MTDVTETISLPESWALAAAQMPQLFKSLAPPLGAPILLMVSGLHAQAAVLAAAAVLDAGVVTMPAQSTPEGVRTVIAQTQPYMVVCAPEVFGWVSKLAFLGGAWPSIPAGKMGRALCWTAPRIARLMRWRYRDYTLRTSCCVSMNTGSPSHKGRSHLLLGRTWVLPAAAYLISSAH